MACTNLEIFDLQLKCYLYSRPKVHNYIIQNVSQNDGCIENKFNLLR